MKSNWSSVVEEFRNIVLESVIIDEKFRQYLKVSIMQTDRFHPFGSDEELSDAIYCMPDRCNYRNLSSFKKWKRGHGNVSDALYSMFLEVEDSIVDHFGDPWNFAPGYAPPKNIEFKWNKGDLPGRSVLRILRAARK